MGLNDIVTAEEPIVWTFNCHYCKKLISVATVPRVIGFCDMACAENRKKVYRRAKSEENGNGDNGDTSSDSDSQEQQADCSEDELLNEETGEWEKVGVSKV